MQFIWKFWNSFLLESFCYYFITLAAFVRVYLVLVLYFWGDGEGLEKGTYFWQFGQYWVGWRHEQWVVSSFLLEYGWIFSQDLCALIHSLPLGMENVTSSKDSSVGIVNFSCWEANKFWKITEPDLWLYVAFFQAELPANRAATMKANSLLGVNNDNYDIESSTCFMNLSPQSHSCISQDYRENITNPSLPHSQLSCRKITKCDISVTQSVKSDW